LKRSNTSTSAAVGTPAYCGIIQVNQ
jgi:hypothetical protein